MTILSPNTKSLAPVCLLRDGRVLAPICLVYLCLAFYRIDNQSLWGDELASVAGAKDSVFTPSRWSGGQGLLYFALLHFWMKVGQTEIVLRSLSTFIGLFGVCFIYAVGIQFKNRKLAAVAAALLATSPFFIWYSQETRYITLAISTSILGMCVFFWAVSVNSFRSWMIYALVTTMSLLSFIPNGFLVIAQGVYLICSLRRWPILPKWLMAQLPLIAIFGTWFLISYGGLSVEFGSRGSQPKMELKPVSLQTGTPRELTGAVIPYTFFTFSVGFSLGPSIRELHISRTLGSLWDHASTLLVLSTIFGALFCFGSIRLLRDNDPWDFLYCWLIVPLVGVFLVAAMTDVAYNVRYVCAAFPAFIIILATAICRLRKPAVSLTVLATVLVVNGISLVNYYFNPRYFREDTRAAARYLERVGVSRDAILLVGSSSAFRHYYQGQLSVVGWDKAVNSDHDSINTNVQELIGRYDRLWLVEIRPWETDPKGNVKAVLKQSLQRTQNIDLPGVEISSYMRKLPLS